MRYRRIKKPQIFQVRFFMKNKHDKKKLLFLRQEARFLKHRLMDADLLEIFTGERAGSREEKKKLHEIISKIQQDIYIEAIYILTHTFINNASEARTMFEEIIQHRNNMVHALKRNVSVHVAALDYLQNIRNILKKPTIIEADKYEEFVYRAIVDETTQAFEKDLLDVDLEAEIERSKRFDNRFSILFIDLDNLKSINDSYGHETGTKAIQTVSNCASQNMRKYDSLYRYGGDEFVVLLPRSNAGEAYHIAKRILEQINKSSFKHVPLRIGASIGIATFDNKRITDRKTLLCAADSALYSAKHAGKNRINIFYSKPNKNKRTIAKKTWSNACSQSLKRR